MKKVIY